jgi:hypothetical protein
MHRIFVRNQEQRGFKHFTESSSKRESDTIRSTNQIMRAYESWPLKKLVINTFRTNLVRYFRPELLSSYQSFGHFSRSHIVANCKGECLLAQRRIAVPFDGEGLCESSRGYNHVEDY